MRCIYYYLKWRAMLWRLGRFFKRWPKSCTPISVTPLVDESARVPERGNDKFQRIFCKETRDFKPLTRPSIALSPILQLLETVSIENLKFLGYSKSKSMSFKTWRFPKAWPNINTPLSVIVRQWLLLGLTHKIFFFLLRKVDFDLI